MDDKDHVFARFHDNKPATANRRETLSIPRRAGAAGGSRVVEVVHVRSSSAAKDRPRRPDAQLRAASWEAGFPMKPPALPPAPDMVDDPAQAATPAPTAHVMPAWEPSTPTSEERANGPIAPAAAAKPRARPARRVADPFDTADDGANCMRCGYAIEASREKRGLMTCAACG